MAKFKKKSEEVEAFKWILGSPNTPKWFYQAFEEGTIWLDESLSSMNFKDEVKKTICIKFKNGVIRATSGDFIIKDSEGKIYSCTFSEFEKLYEEIEHTATIENLTNYAENLQQGHKHINEEKNEESKLELSAKLELDTTDFKENIKNATKEIEIFNKAADRLEKKINRMFGREKVNEVKINIPIISKSGSAEKASESLLKELKSQKLIVSEKDKKFKKYDICFKNGECISGVIKEHVADKLTAYFSDSQSDIDCLRAIEDEEKLVMFNTANVQTITISDYIENEEIDYI
ncbi:hypothetical protein [Clostridioides difficile]|uniref:hypothetical protein n=1 Tax=Clostridioides difficile TaxID=1496 RepID=UPI001C17800A|nr:hypothetical protein [Clostridioides difficile]MDV9291978.1 hypothetical protein [Clostridioides difficile]HBF6260022.1 hypothetical protein [Clostridioides difficile]HBY2797819.1 hypothetical protein [Clostridioides difficile]